MPYPSSISLYQDIATIPGATYTFSFAFSPRPDDADVSDSVAKVSWNNTTIDTVSATSVDPAHTTWTIHTYTATATASTTRIAFDDGGHPNALGAFIDSVSVTCASGPVIPGGNAGGGVGGGVVVPVVAASSTLTVIKNVINANGGTATSSDFSITVSGVGVSTTSATSSATTVTFPGSLSGTVLTLLPGIYSVDEVAAGSYTKSLSADCSGTLNAGDVKVCTITNTDPVPSPAVGVGGSGGGSSGSGSGPAVITNNPSTGGGSSTTVTPDTSTSGGNGGIIAPPVGQVLGTSTQSVPGVPNTGTGGELASTALALSLSFFALILASVYLGKKTVVVNQ